MKTMKETTKWPLFRLIIPAFPEINVFTRIARKTTALGPIMVATVADKLWGWRIEVIDENNYRKGERDNQGFPDHFVLQKERPALVVGFYCGLSNTMERVWQLADFYQSPGVSTLAGGWHVHYLPEESLNRGIDVVVHGDAELVIQKLLTAFKQGDSVNNLPGISFWENGQIKTNPVEEVSDLNNLPFPNFGLLRNAKIKIYPIGRIRGCSKNCEFCSVRGKSRWANAEHLFGVVNYLTETRGAKQFFIVDDRLEEDKDGTIQFFTKIAEKYGRSLKFTVQTRLEAAKDKELLVAMKKAGVREVCIGYESPIDEELKLMRKGCSSADMLKWTKTYHDFGFFIHGMFIFGYPYSVSGAALSPKERAKHFKKFIHQASLDTIQVLRPVPLVGTDLRSRLEREGKLLPLKKVSWSRYDGSYACYQPDNMSLKELQETPLKIMKWFYHSRSFWRIGWRTLIMPFDYLMRGWHPWYRGWRNDIKRYGGYLLVRQWLKRYQ